MCSADTDEDTCWHCALGELSTPRGLAGTLVDVLNSIKLQAWGDMGVIHIRTKSADVVVPLPDDLVVHLSGEDVNALVALAADIRDAVELG